eukprot:1299287-Rhodomonas_salina.1
MAHVLCMTGQGTISITISKHFSTTATVTVPVIFVGTTLVPPPAMNGFRVPGLKENCNVSCSLAKLLRQYKKNSSWT